MNRRCDVSNRHLSRPSPKRSDTNDAVDAVEANLSTSHLTSTFTMDLPLRLEVYVSPRSR